MKDILRKKFKHLRSTSSLHQNYSFEVLYKWVLDRKVDRIFLYAGVDGEPNPLEFDWSLNYALPRMRSLGSMDFIQIDNKSMLQPNRFGILEPIQGEICIPTQHSIILVPAVSVDTKGTRIGMGGGYYDRYLEKYSLGFKIGIVLPVQVSPEDLPRDSHDVSMDAIYDGDTVRFTHEF